MPRFSFSLQNRLRSPEVFDSVFKSGKRISNRYFVLIYLPNNQNIARLGIVISKRKCRLSVHRSHLRRCIREQFRQIPELAGYDVVVLLKTVIVNPKGVAIADCMGELFERML